MNGTFTCIFRRPFNVFFHPFHLCLKNIYVLSFAMFTKTLHTFSVWRSFRIQSAGASNASNGRLAVREPHPDHLQVDDYFEEHALEPAREDLSLVAIHMQNTFNFAAYINRSETLKYLVNLGVDLSKIEKKPYVAEAVMKMDFEKDMKQHLFFLKDYVGDDGLGAYITKNPLIFNERLQDLEVRINYLMYKKFQHEQIQHIVTKNPFWLMFSTIRIDRRLGYFQSKFHLNGAEVRELSQLQPRIVTYNLNHVNTNCFVIKEEMGFDDHEIKKLLLTKPKLWMINQLSLIRRFNYIHNTMKISHKMILRCPDVLLCREFLIQQRHSFLQRLGRAQYDPRRENYVPLIALAAGTDADFCRDFAKCTVDDFNTFLKTL